jgi:hypothetical protein
VAGGHLEVMVNYSALLSKNSASWSRQGTKAIRTDAMYAVIKRAASSQTDSLCRSQHRQLTGTIEEDGVRVPVGSRIFYSSFRPLLHPTEPMQ